MIAIQRRTGNRSTATLLAGSYGAGSPAVQRQPTVGGVVSGIEDVGEEALQGVEHTVIPGIESVAPMGSAAISETTSGEGVIQGGIGIGLAAYSHYNRTKRLAESRKQQNQGRIRANERGQSTAGGSVASSTLSTAKSISGTVTGGYEIANLAGTASTTAAQVGGVATSAIALPVQIFNLIRTSRRAHLQRKRMNAVQNSVQAMKSLSDEERGALSVEGVKSQTERARLQFAEAMRNLSSARHELDVLTTRQTEENRRLEELREAIALTEKDLAEAKAREPRSDFSAADGELQLYRSNLVAQQKAVQEATEAVAEQRSLVQTYEESVEEHRAGAEQHRAQGEIEEGIASSGQLTEKGEKDTKVPSLEEIADYALAKNRRGFARRAIGAGAAGLGVAAGAIGVAAAVEKFTGGASAGDLGIAGAVIGGAAALIGLGVGIWKAVSFVKKRKEQRKRMIASGGADPGTFKTYNPTSLGFGAGMEGIDQSTKRRHHATALYLYATAGTTTQRQRASEIMTSLDPKGPWAQKDPRTQAFVPYERAADPDEEKSQRADVIQHLMDKMGSGG